MKLNILFIFLITNSVCFGAIRDNSNFLDIIIDDTHAYTHLNCASQNGGSPYSVYASLIPKEDDCSGIEHFPRILKLLVEAGDVVAEHTLGSTLSEITREDDDFNDGQDDEMAGFTLREVIQTFAFSLFYMVSDYIDIGTEGKITNDKPAPDEIRIRRRFYLTPEQAKKAKILIKRSTRESLEGKVVYDKLNHNCIDFVKEIYEGIGLDKTQGDFLSQFGLESESDMEEIEGENPAYTLLMAYKVHNEGMIGLKQVMTLMWNIVKVSLGC